ncbi:uncharacterized protein ACRADG_002068 [Cochliomyia hominivorax]
MSVTSRTGLVPTPKKARRLLVKKSDNANLPQNFEALPMALSLRPFGGLFNPFAKGCSVLCNHPASAEVKQIINQCKQSLSVEGKNIAHLQHAALKEKSPSPIEPPDNIPEDLFRRYTDTDSRPLTPTPTVTSIHTRTSAGSFLNNRRCITPELGNNDMIKRKKIILDLRRSHSQETLYWKPCSDLSSGGGFGDSDLKARSAGAIEEKKNRKQKSEEQQQRPKSSLATTTIQEESGEGGLEAKKVLHTCINEQDYADEDIRRGKRRKKIKTVAASATTFHLSQDPETQVAALGPDSLNPSTRPSLIPNAANLLPSQEKRASEEVLLKGSFLTDEAFQALKIKLDIDLIENTFDRYLNRAYREAYRYLPLKPRDHNDVVNELEKLNMISEKMPRKFSKSATRFDVPMDLKSIENMTALHYLGKYVWVSRQRKQIYKRIFLKYLKTTTEQPPEITQPQQQQQLKDINFPLPEYQERYMNPTYLYQALEDVLEFYGTEKNINKVLELINYQELLKDNEKQELLINFRSWCGIVAFAERLALDDPLCTDSCDELEKMDFNSLEMRLNGCKINEKLNEVFEIIRNTHVINN